MWVVKCCQCGTIIRLKEKDKKGIQITHTYCDNCYHELKDEIKMIHSTSEVE